MGWTVSLTGAAWELLGSRGEVLSAVSAAYVEEHGAAEVNAYGSREPRFWPPLRPGEPDLRCVLTGGPGGVEHHYLPAGELVPPHLVVRGLVFRLCVHCGHPQCPYHYLAAEHAC